MAHDVFRTLVIEFKLISAEYFMERLRDWEVYEYYSNLDVAARSEWEQTRQICYCVAQVNSRRKLRPTDLMKFRWDAYAKKDDLTDARLDELRTEARRIEAIMQKKSNSTTA